MAFRKTVRIWNQSDSDEVIEKIFRSTFRDLAEYLNDLPEDESPQVVSTGLRSVQKHARELSAVGPSVNWSIAFERTIRRNSRTHALYSSLLVSATSAFEVLVAAVLRCQYQAVPKTLSRSEKRYSFADVVEFSSIEEFGEACIDDAIENVMRGDVQSWFEPIRRWYDIGLSDISDESDQIVEAYLRRNLIVHNGGIKNRIYLSKSKDPDAAGDMQVNIDRGYVMEVIDRLQIAGLILVARVFDKLGAGEDWAKAVKHDLVSESSYDLLVNGRNRAVVELGNLIKITNCDGSADLVVKVNRWIAMKCHAGLEAIRAEVDLWDVSILSMRYRLAKYALLDDFERAARLVPAVVGTPELTQAEFNAWPLLKGVREYLSNQKRLEELEASD